MTSTEITAYINEKLPDNQRITAETLRIVLNTISLDILSTNSGTNVLPEQFGYSWIKGDGNSDLEDIEEGDELDGVGTLYPGYRVRLYVHTIPVNQGNPNLTCGVIYSYKIPN